MPKYEGDDVGGDSGSFISDGDDDYMCMWIVYVALPFAS